MPPLQAEVHSCPKLWEGTPVADATLNSVGMRFFQEEGLTPACTDGFPTAQLIDG